MADLSSQSRKVVKKAEGIGLAQVTFRVRCEKIGHGESVFLSQADDPAAGNQVREELERQSSLNQFSHFFFHFWHNFRFLSSPLPSLTHGTQLALPFHWPSQQQHRPLTW